MVSVPKNACARIWALVCGLAPDKRGKRLFLVLRAFMDGSGGRNHSGALVLAGYVSTVDKWLAFSKEWQLILEMPLRLRYFKMNEAVNLKSEFADWSESRRDERLRLFYGAIEQHVEFFLICIIPFVEFDKAVGKLPPFGFHPYYLAWAAIMGQIRKHQASFGITEKIDFVFDEEVMEKSVLLKNWCDMISATPPEESQFVGSTPVFEDDEDFLPIQAADLIAWIQRNRWQASNEGVSLYIPCWAEKRDIPGMIITYDEASIGRVLRPAARRLTELGQG